MTSICDERGQELIYAGMPITEVFKQDMGIGGVLSLLWFQVRKYEYTKRVFLFQYHAEKTCGLRLNRGLGHELLRVKDASFKLDLRGCGQDLALRADCFHL